MTIATIIIITVCIYGLLAWANSRVGVDAPNMKPDYFAEKPAIFDDKTVLMWDGKAFSIKPVHIDYLADCEWPGTGAAGSFRPNLGDFSAPQYHGAGKPFSRNGGHLKGDV